MVLLLNNITNLIWKQQEPFLWLQPGTPWSLILALYLPATLNIDSNVIALEQDIGKELDSFNESYIALGQLSAGSQSLVIQLYYHSSLLFLSIVINLEFI